MRPPIRTSLALFRNRWYVLGIVVALTGWGFHVGALALAPISLVQSVIAGGLVLLTVTPDRQFPHQVTRREWIGVALAALGLAFLAATLDGVGDEARSDYESARLIAYIALASVAAVTVAVAGYGGAREGVLFGSRPAASGPPRTPRSRRSRGSSARRARRRSCSVRWRR